MGLLPEIRGWSCSTNRAADEKKARGGETTPGLSAAADGHHRKRKLAGPLHGLCHVSMDKNRFLCPG
jgi:hypothetical protein